MHWILREEYARYLSCLQHCFVVWIGKWHHPIRPDLACCHLISLNALLISWLRVSKRCIEARSVFGTGWLCCLCTGRGRTSTGTSVRHRLLDDVIYHSPRACKKTPTSISCDSLTSNFFHTSRDSVAARRPPQTTVPSAHLPGRLRLILHRSVDWFKCEGKAANAANTVS